MTVWSVAAWLSYWRRAPIQLVAIVFGLALSTALWSAVQAINSSARASYARAEQQLSGASFTTITPRNGLISLDQYIRMRKQGWKVSPVWEGQSPLGDGNLRLMVVDLLSHPFSARITDAAAGDPQMLSTVPIFVHPDTLNHLPAEELAQFSPMTQLPKGVGLTDFARATALIGDVKEFSYLIDLGQNNRQLSLPDNLQMRRQSAPAQLGQLTDSFHLNLTAFGLLAFVVGLFIVQSTVKISIEQRRGMIRTLRSLGMPLRRLILLSMGELMGFAILAGALGLGLGYFIAAALLPGVSATLSGLYGAQVDGRIDLQPSWVISGMAMTILGTALAGGTSLWQIYRLPILHGPAIRARGLQAAQSHIVGARFGIALLVSSPILILFDNLLAGFALIGTMLVGGVLILPFCLSKVLQFFERRSAPGMSQWIWADMRAQLSMLTVPLMAMSLAISANIGVETMTSSFRLTFVNWINQRFDADVYLRFDDPAQGQKILDWLETTAVDFRPLWTTKMTADHPTQIYGVSDIPYYATDWPMITIRPQGWTALHHSQGIMINEQMARGRQIWPGQTVEIAQGTALPVLGVYPDYGNPEHQIIMSKNLILTYFPDSELRSVALSNQGDSSVINHLQDIFQVPTTAVLDQDQLRRQSLRIFDQTFLITAALNVLTLSVAGFALLTSFLALWGQRLPQVAPMWALGLRPSLLARHEALRSIGLAFFVALFGIPLGLSLAWALLSVTNVQAFGWKLPMFFFPAALLKSVSFALLAAAAACLPSVLRLVRIQPSELLKVFSSER